MLTEERYSIILDKLKSFETVKIQELIDITGASESTIRRDLTELEKKKFIKRIHGGARRMERKMDEPGMEEKSVKNLHQKQQIAQAAAALVEEGDCIFIDAGSTTSHMIPFLPEGDIIVVTNGLMHIEALMKKGIRTYLTGGAVKPKTNALIGRGAIDSLNGYRFDKAFMGTNGVHYESGYTTPDPEEAQVKAAAISLSREAFVLADSEKIGEIAFARFGELSEAVLITETFEENAELYKNQTSVKEVEV
ncbi:DeoR/GlpR family DNA-binding transcription regulator [Jeotgalibacillus sp. HH7-29]|uniref:DeoR/GlpR family DNA-binding transcription regulator n=1 Tax=Jeotgalibacillus haloalkalitolerans TaxID=3104292 RepID=A0ABU5KIT9_9BACL|nr:DeoR/GlpR family DNA-binding transcription regulator [Jeotgalibacillus sp. HH7-29]MDZ5711169.1 DeoR/GlpR family DNA-binding transcription regulator [Jeotgalibacillus sp. HH7-29]